MTAITIRDLLTDPALLGGQFAGPTWATWRVLLSGFYGLALTETERGIFETLTKRAESPKVACSELWMVIGRRGGKSQMAALLAVFEACFNDHAARLSPGEVATIMVLAADRKQARVCTRYISGLLNSNPMLKRLILKEGQESIELSNRSVIEVGTASFRSVRGYTLACVIADEIAFWRSDESANPDKEIISALRPALTTLSGKLIALSSPYSKRGELFRTYQKHFGKPGGILVAQAETLRMNPTIPIHTVYFAMERDPEAASAEFMALFRSDLEQFLLREVVDLAVRSSPLELPYDKRHKYTAFVDPAGGGADSFTLAIGHKEGEATVIDVLRARRGVPAEITAGYAALLKTYNIRKVTGDKYGGSWPSTEFEKHGIKYDPSQKPKSGLYLDLLPALNSGRVELPPDTRLVNELLGLERRTARSGKDSIDHPPGGHDDLANVIAGQVSTKAGSSYDLELFINGTRADDRPKRTHTGRRPLIEALRQAGIPLN
ncbi:hypothetical protein ACFL3I_06780 [Pseudomonadota bacterium]